MNAHKVYSRFYPTCSPEARSTRETATDHKRGILAQGESMSDDVQLTPSWKLTTDHAASSYDAPVLVNKQNEAFGPGDIIEPYRGWGLQPAARAVERMAKMSARSDDEGEAVARFCGR